MEKYVCIHGHFYQPPRENPWLETVELQDSAYPYHDWNERITAECYEPNTAARILDGDGRIVDILNTYSRISFNFGPTLLRWMEEKAPEAYAGIVDADRRSLERFEGHGSALFQPYSHAILPLMNARDKKTQVLWGIADFEHRFGRRPEGAWLPEAAVDLETLDLIAEQGVAFTVLAPHQAARCRPLENGGDWQEVSEGRIDPTRPYVQKLPSGRSIVLFFYDGPVSRGIAFEKLLSNGERFAARLLSLFNDGRDWPQLVHVATDGETYGHHHRHGDMALAYALRQIEKTPGVKVVNYGLYLAKHPPTCEVEIYENSSWSCVHGVERWKANCGCNSGMKPGWHQEWRGPLRAALDRLRDRLAPLYEQHGGRLFQDPWAARDAYVQVVLDRSPENVDRFLDKHARGRLHDADVTTALKLLELQRHAMLMYTSCGWFFDELSGIETVQVILYAGCAIQIAEEALGVALESEFVKDLEKAKSNVPEHQNGRVIYDKWVKPASVDLQRVAAHYAVSSLFESYGDRSQIYAFDIERKDGRVLKAGRAKLSLGYVRVTSQLTRDSVDLTYGVLHVGDHHVTGGLRMHRGHGSYRAMVDEVAGAFERADLTEVIRLLDREFLELTYSLKSLFHEEQRKVLQLVLESTLGEAEAIYRQIYENHAPLLRYLTELRIPPPPAFFEAARFVLNAQLRRAMKAEPLDVDRIQVLLDEAARAKIPLDAEGLSFALQSSLERIVERLAREPDDAERLARLRAAAELVQKLPFEVDLWKVQNVYWRLLKQTFPDVKAKRPTPREWVDDFVSLGGSLGIRVAA